MANNFMGLSLTTRPQTNK